MPRNIKLLLIGLFLLSVASVATGNKNQTKNCVLPPQIQVIFGPGLTRERARQNFNCDIKTSYDYLLETGYDSWSGEVTIYIGTSMADLNQTFAQFFPDQKPPPWYWYGGLTQVQYADDHSSRIIIFINDINQIHENDDALRLSLLAHEMTHAAQFSTSCLMIYNHWREVRSTMEGQAQMVGMTLLLSAYDGIYRSTDPRFYISESQYANFLNYHSPNSNGGRLNELFVKYQKSLCQPNADIKTNFRQVFGWSMDESLEAWWQYRDETP